MILKPYYTLLFMHTFIINTKTVEKAEQDINENGDIGGPT